MPNNLTLKDGGGGAQAVIGISVLGYWKISFYPLHTDTNIFYGGNTDIDTELDYPKFYTEILKNTEYFPVSK